MVRCAALIVPLACLPAAAAAQAGDSVTSLTQGVYTADQARRGQAVYERVCGECHLPEFFTETFLQSWSGAPLSLLFDLIISTMPEDRPGSLDRREYADVLAYIFQLNGLPPGDGELRAEQEFLERILIERRK